MKIGRRSVVSIAKVWKMAKLTAAKENGDKKSAMKKKLIFLNKIFHH
jgi:hypothetical protein